MGDDMGNDVARMLASVTSAVANADRTARVSRDVAALLMGTPVAIEQNARGDTVYREEGSTPPPPNPDPRPLQDAANSLLTANRDAQSLLRELARVVGLRIEESTAQAIIEFVESPAAPPPAPKPTKPKDQIGHLPCPGRARRRILR